MWILTIEFSPPASFRAESINQHIVHAVFRVDCYLYKT